MIQKYRTSEKGFTLIELMIVVAIIGILAAIAIPNFIRFQLKSKSSEGKVNLAAIRTAEESYMAEFGAYVAAGASPPVASVTSAKIAFVDADNFGTLGWSPEGKVYFSYGVATNADSFFATATADIDGDATDQTWGYKKTTALTAATPVATCAITDLDQVGPCTTAMGQSIF
jgi:type IV pilus assembly protein PilA